VKVTAGRKSVTLTLTLEDDEIQHLQTILYPAKKYLNGAENDFEFNLWSQIKDETGIKQRDAIDDEGDDE
jgi:hypothetical protein